jgi:adenosylcobinamide-phosphate synthase
MSNILSAIIAYLIDKRFGEFSFMVHPLSYVKEMNAYFEETFFKDSVLRGLLLVMFVIGIVSFFAISIALFLPLMPLVVNIVISGFIASMFISNAIARKASSALFKKETPKQTISTLVKHDTNIKNLSDAMIAPIFYLLIFGIAGIIIYKAINTLYQELDAKKTKHIAYEKVARGLNSGLNFIPSYLLATVVTFVNRD